MPAPGAAGSFTCNARRYFPLDVRHTVPHAAGSAARRMHERKTIITRVSLSRLPSLVMGGISLGAVLILAACGSTSSGPATTHPGSSPAAVVHTAQVSVKGTTETVLTDAKGFTLYFYTPDTASTAACTAGCAKAWPPLIATSGTPTSNTPLPVTFGVLDGANGKQVTCNGHPLYTFAGDKAPGTANGEDVGGVWFVATPGVASLAADASSATVHTAKVTIAGTSATVLTAPNGLTLYYFTPDTASTVACTGACAKAWPPLMASADAVTSDHGLPGKLGVIDGPNGKQVTYNGHPLYTFARDMAPGQVNGQGLFGKWFVAKPDLAAQ